MTVSKLLIIVLASVPLLVIAHLIEGALGIVQTPDLTISHLLYMAVGAGAALVGVWTRR